MNNIRLEPISELPRILVESTTGSLTKFFPVKSLHLNSLINVYITVSLAQFINLSLECHKEGSKPEIFPFSGCRPPYFCIIFGRRHDEKLISYFTTRHDWILFGLWGSVLNLQNIGLITSRMASALFSRDKYANKYNSDLNCRD